MFRSIGLTVAATFVGQALGFLVDILVARHFGTSWKADAYFLALVIPVLLSDLFTLAINSVFIPIYMSQRKDSGEDTFFSAVTNLVALLTVLTATAMYVFAPHLVELVGGRFTAQAKELTVTITRLLLVVVVTVPLSTVFSNRLNAHEWFVLPALAKSFNFVCIIAALFALKGAIDIYSLPAGYIAGNVLFVGALAYFLRRSGLGYSAGAGVRHPAMAEIGVLVIPIAVGFGANYVNVMVERGIAAGFMEGSIASLNYAFKLVNIPVNLFVLAGMSVILPMFSRYAADGDLKNLGETTARGLRLVTFFILPVVVGFAVFRVPLVRLLFERGKFSASSTDATSTAVLFYIFGIIGLSAVAVMSRVFYALKDMKTLNALGVAIIVLNIALMISLSRAFGFIGIPLAFSVISTVHMLAMLLVLGRRLGASLFAPLGNTFLRQAVAALMTCAISLAFVRAAGSYQGLSSGVALAVYLCAAGAVVSGTYLAVSYVLRVEEASYVFNKGRALLQRF